MVQDAPLERAFEVGRQDHHRTRPEIGGHPRIVDGVHGGYGRGLADDRDATSDLIDTDAEDAFLLVGRQESELTGSGG